jgi:Zn-dependent metalloprotease
MTRTTLQKTLIALAACTAMAAQAQGSASLSGQRDAIARLSAQSGGNSQVAIHAATGAARFVKVSPGGKLRAQARAAASTDAAKHNESVQFLTEYSGLFGITNAASEFGPARIEKDRYGATHLTYKQVYRGVPVFAGEMKTHFDSADSLVVANGTFVPGIDVNPVPTRSAEEGKRAALANVTAELTRATKGKVVANEPTLMIYREGLAQGIEGANHLAWQVEVGNRHDVREFVFVDAHTGKVIDKISGIHEAKNRRAFDGAGATQPGPNYPGSPFWVEGNPFPTGTTEADNMIAASSEIYDLFKIAFGRDSFDGAGGTMDSIFNRGNSCPNASWNGVYISFCPGVTTDDITAHEWGHAYTEFTHGLIYAWQPGALNEAYSDIWGETVDRINGRGGDTPDAARTAGACTTSTPAPPSVNITSPAAIAGFKTAGTAAFGPATFSLAGTLAGVDVGTTNAACSALPAGSLTGKIAFIDRGTCGFGIKAANAELAGAVAVIIGNNQGGTAVINMAVTAGVTNTIPTLSVSQNDGTAIKAQLGATTVSATLARGGNGTDSSVRWLMGEDSTGFGGAIRDMYNPVCYGNPGKVSDAQYVCAATPDAGGVHSNSGVPNHAYAMLVDGGSYNGQSISAIGLTKAAHMYYRAQSVYQGPASGFSDHADALQQSCTDLLGANLANLKTGAPSGEIMNASDCAQVAKAAQAVEMRTPPTQCNFQPMLAKSPPPLCTTGTAVAVASDTFEGGKRGGIKWLLSNVGSAPEFKARNWGVVSNLPDARPGYGIFSVDYAGGTCSPGGDQTGVQRLDSPEITIPASATTLRMTFDHWMSSEAGFDGGNLKISVNGGAWQLVKAVDFIYNPYNATLTTAAAGNTNPMAGEPAFTGADGGSVSGSWGRSIVNLAPYAAINDKVKLRFEMGNDGCGGAFGWYLDDVMVYRCAPAN